MLFRFSDSAMPRIGGIDLPATAIRNPHELSDLHRRLGRKPADNQTAWESAAVDAVLWHAAGFYPRPQLVFIKCDGLRPNLEGPWKRRE